MEELTLITPNEPEVPRFAAKRCGNRARALFEPLLAHQQILRRILDAGLGEWIGVKLLDLRNPAAVRDRALIRVQQLPPREILHAWDDELSHALDGKADEKTLSVLLTTLLDGFPRGMVPNIPNLCRRRAHRYRRPSPCARNPCRRDRSDMAQEQVPADHRGIARRMRPRAAGR